MDQQGSPEVWCLNGEPARALPHFVSIPYLSADFLECLQSGRVEEFQRSGSGMSGDCARGG